MAHGGKQSSVAPLRHGALGWITDSILRWNRIAAVPRPTPVIAGKAGKAGREVRILSTAQPQRQYQGSIFFADSMSRSNGPQRHRPFLSETVDQRCQLTLLSKGFPIITAFPEKQSLIVLTPEEIYSSLRCCDQQGIMKKLFPFRRYHCDPLSCGLRLSVLYLISPEE